MAYLMKKAQLLAQMRMSSGKKPPQKIQVNGRNESWLFHAVLEPVGGFFGLFKTKS